MVLLFLHFDIMAEYVLQIGEMGLRKSTSRNKIPADELERRVTNGALRTCRSLYMYNRHRLHTVWHGVASNRSCLQLSVYFIPN